MLEVRKVKGFVQMCVYTSKVIKQIEAKRLLQETKISGAMMK